MAVGLLDRAEIGEYLQGVGAGARGQKAAGCLDQVARPHQMIPAKVFVAFAETPWDRQACDSRARKAKRAVRGQNRRTDTIGIQPRLGRAIERKQVLLPVAPARDSKSLQRRRSQPSGWRVRYRRLPVGARTEGKRE